PLPKSPSPLQESSPSFSSSASQKSSQDTDQAPSSPVSCSPPENTCTSRLSDGEVKEEKKKGEEKKEQKKSQTADAHASNPKTEHHGGEGEQGGRGKLSSSQNLPSAKPSTPSISTSGNSRATTLNASGRDVDDHLLMPPPSWIPKPLSRKAKLPRGPQRREFLLLFFLR
ncbi:hypothetical protein CSUI_002727, partial [Cystoisospora suis]